MNSRKILLMIVEAYPWYFVLSKKKFKMDKGRHFNALRVLFLLANIFLCIFLVVKKLCVNISCFHVSMYYSQS